MESLHCSLSSETKEETAALRKKVELLGSKMEEFEDTSKSASSRPKRFPRDLSVSRNGTRRIILTADVFLLFRMW